MNIASTIAKYRKARGMTQEALGEALGVSNQAVSKWENAVSLPDISLLPTLARALGITLDRLLGEDKQAEEYLHPDDLPEAAYDALHRTLDKLWRHGGGNAEARIAARKEKLAKIKSGMAECVANTCGAVLVTDSLSLVDRTYKKPESETILLSRRLAAVLERMAEEDTRRVLAFLYRETFAEPCEKPPFIPISRIEAACDLTEEAVEQALFTLENLHIVEICNSDRDTECCLRTSYAICALDLFKLADLLVSDRIWHEVRNTQVILDAAFCGYLPPYQPSK